MKKKNKQGLVLECDNEKKCLYEKYKKDLSFYSPFSGEDDFFTLVKQEFFDHYSQKLVYDFSVDNSTCVRFTIKTQRGQEVKYKYYRPSRGD